MQAGRHNARQTTPTTNGSRWRKPLIGPHQLCASVSRYLATKNAAILKQKTPHTQALKFPRVTTSDQQTRTTSSRYVYALHDRKYLPKQVFQLHLQGHRANYLSLLFIHHLFVHLLNPSKFCLIFIYNKIP